MFTLHCALENVADLYVNECQKIRLGLLKKEERRRPNRDFFYFARCVRKITPDPLPQVDGQVRLLSFVLYFVLYFCVVYYILLLYLIVFYHLYIDVVHSFDWKSAVEP